jgi:threonine aldolase
MTHRFIDLRSDTVTRPTAAMRRAMTEAEVGDDVYGEDPTVNRLEQRAAEILGKEAALFVPSGTMGNTIAIKIHTEHGQEIVCDAHAHILDWELSMTAWFSGCLVRSVATEDGILRWERIKGCLRPGGPHCAPTALIEIENTHNMAGGTVYPLEVIREICAEAQDAGLKVHMDGARIFNASVATGVPVRTIAAGVDTVMFCLSKGLGAPVGSLVAGSAEAIAKGRLYRKRLGGGMRQAGILAAAGLVALEQMPQRLAEDHANARLFAERIARSPGVRVDLNKAQTNIVMVDVSGTGLPAARISEMLKREGVLMNPVGSDRLRAVTHYDVSRSDCEHAADLVVEIATSASSGAAARAERVR